jgi:hypothetical protein
MESLKRHSFSNLDRRQFLKHSTAATLAALTGSAPKLFGSEAQKRIEPRADTLILLWMAGGMAQTETFDPKLYTPYASGLESKRVLSTFPSIPTAVDGINLSQGLERLASVMDRGTLIRSHRVGDLGFILHSRHQFHWHTGYEPPQSVAVPHLGAFISRTLGPKNDVLTFIIGQNLAIGAESDSLKAFHTAGFWEPSMGLSLSLIKRRGGQHAPTCAHQRCAGSDMSAIANSWEAAHPSRAATTSRNPPTFG